MIVLNSSHVTSSKMSSCSHLCFFFLLIFFTAQGKAKIDSSDFKNSSTFQGDHAKQDDEAENCIDWERRVVADGEKYLPHESDLCMECVCLNGSPDLCQSVACSAPQNCAHARLVPGKCCEYECLSEVPHDHGNNTKETDPSNETKESITNLSLRLIASTVTSLLFLALLLFMVYRLRQRRLLLAMRRFEARSRNSNNIDDTDSEHYIPENFLALECPPYTDPPPPYSPPKPPHFYMGEQPPAYDEISLAGETVELASGGRPPQPRRSGQGGEVTSDAVPRPQIHANQVSSGRRAPTVISNETNQNSSTCPEGSLPAYASTDVVHNVDNMLSSGPQGHLGGWNVDGVLAEQQNSVRERNGNAVTFHGHQHSMDRSTRIRHNQPPVTAFQRFSSLFKRNAPKFKTRNGQTRPVSECPPPSFYATLPHNDLGGHMPSVGYTSFSNSNRRSRNSTRSATRSLTDRMCFSYDSARAAYELAAMSPSTSSNSSSSGGLASCSPRGREISQQNPLHSQQFQDDLRRHLPPLQTSDSSELLAQSSPGTCQSTLSPSSSMNQSILSPQRPSSKNCQEPPAITNGNPHPDDAFSENRILHDREATSSIIYDLTGSLPHLRSPIQSQSQQPIRREVRQPTNHEAHDPSDMHRMPSFPQHTPSTYPSFSPPSQGQISPRSYTEGDEASNSLASHANNIRNERKSPSPPAQGGLMRRSHSALSEVSMFSVCSETGEKKLREGEAPGADSKVLASDCQYPDHHHSLSRSALTASPQRAQHLRHQNASDSCNGMATCGPDVGLNADLSVRRSPATLFIPSHRDAGGEGVGEERIVEALREGQTPKTLQNTSGGDNCSNLGSKVEMDIGQSARISSNLPLCSSSPFVTAQSGKLIVDSFRKQKSNGAVDADAKLTADAKHVHSEIKKIKKKKPDKEKHNNHSNSNSNSQHHHPNQKSKNSAGSALGASNSNNFMKPDVPSRNSKPRLSSKPHSSRNGERKKRSVSSLAPHLENSDFMSTPHRMIQSYDDSLMGVGNADVYRNYGCDVTSPPSALPHEYPFSHRRVDNKFATGSSRDHYDVPPAFKTLAAADRTMGHAKEGHVDLPSQPPLTKKKPAHKRQSSVGDKVPGNNSPSRQRSRTKSSVCPVDRGSSNKNEVEVSSFEHGASVGKGAKSGFGHDLNFDDQMGMIDFFNEGVDYSATKTRGRASFGNDSCLPLTPNIRSTTRGSVEIGNLGQNGGNSRSGLSSDLSFTNGSCQTGEKSKKRASLPSLPIFSHGSMNTGAKNYCSKLDERTERDGERRRHENLQDCDFTHATSYV